MWFEKPPRAPGWNAARKHLSRVDPVMKRIIARVGPCTLAPRRDYFVALCRSIYAQQISTRIATILFDRFSENFPRRRPTPARVVELLSNGDEAALKRCGLSRQKKAYVLDLARHFVSGEIPTRSFAGMSDEQVIETLTRVNGIGRWTAEMFLIFVLNREDVLPVDDLGVREAARIAYKLPDRPGARELTKRGEIWRPHRSVATWYLWRSLQKKN